MTFDLDNLPEVTEENYREIVEEITMDISRRRSILRSAKYFSLADTEKNWLKTFNVTTEDINLYTSRYRLYDRDPFDVNNKYAKQLIKTWKISVPRPKTESHPHQPETRPLTALPP